jgi:hypothetical protein
MTSIKPRTAIFLAAFVAVLCTSAAVALGTTRDSAALSSTHPAEPEATPTLVVRSSRAGLDADAILPYILTYGDAHSLIAARRPHWLTSWPEVSTVRVHRDGIPVGGPDALRSIPLGSVQQIKWLNGNEASSRFGPTHSGSAILVTTR